MISFQYRLRTTGFRRRMARLIRDVGGAEIHQRVAHPQRSTASATDLSPPRLAPPPSRGCGSGRRSASTNYRTNSAATGAECQQGTGQWSAARNARPPAPTRRSSAARRVLASIPRRASGVGVLSQSTVSRSRRPPFGCRTSGRRRRFTARISRGVRIIQHLTIRVCCFYISFTFLFKRDNP